MASGGGDDEINIPDEGNPTYEPAGTRRAALHTESSNSRLVEVPISLSNRNGDEENGGRGMRLVIYDLSCKLGDAVLLKNVTGVVEPGQFFAVMGPSGAGKTMLLDAVCYRKTTGLIKGVVLYNGKLPTREFMQHNVAYVEQEITINNSFTVSEAILYAALLKRSPQQHTRKQIDLVVDHVIEQLGLGKIRNSRIGNSKLIRGISGGEARRVSIGIGLVGLTRPGLLCLDEPTTGLDSAIGTDILKLVKKCTDEGWTVFSTIHNPSTMMMDSIDGLVLLVSARLIWFGAYDSDVIKADYSANGFQSGKSIHIVEYLLQVVGGGSKGSEEKVLDKACEVCANSETCKKNNAAAIAYAQESGVDRICMDWRKPKSEYICKEAGSDLVQHKEADFANTVCDEIRILFRFRAWALLTDPNFVLTRLAIFVVQSFIFATFWCNQEKNVDGLIDTIAILFAVPVSLSVPLSLYIPEMINHRASFIREQHEGCYRVVSYFVTVVLTEFIVVLVGGTIFTLIIYWALGTFPNNPNAFFFYLLNTIIMAFNSVLFAVFSSTVNRTLEMALLVAPLYWLWNALVMGFIAKYESIPVWYRWTYWLAYLQYAFSGYLLNQFQGQEWSMCSEASGAFDLQSILDGLSSGDVGNATVSILTKLQQTMEDATNFQFPFQVSQAYCLDDSNGTDVITTLPELVNDAMPNPQILQTISNILPSFLNLNSETKCDELCLPVPGDGLIEMYGHNPDENKWERLGFATVFVLVHASLFYASLLYAKLFEKR
mmetsp:Transcript_6882/g.17591  ORF Transcript_6882/g.17591 Transcript_6882/m.17591 type:complete len:771 (-) Transcript_6882:1746-4058(-)